MRKYKNILLVLMFVIVNSLLISQDYNNLFEKANEKYINKNYREALDIYLKIENSISDYKLYFNIGNTYYKLNNYLMAKVYYLKAMRLNPLDDDLYFNLKLVNEKFKDKIELNKMNSINRLIFRLESIFSINVGFVLVLILIYVFNYSIYLRFVKKKFKRLNNYLIIGSLILIVLLTFYINNRISYKLNSNSGIIMYDNVSLYSGPNDSNTVLYKVNSGLDFRIINKINNWVQIKSNEIVGWVKTDKIKII